MIRYAAIGYVENFLKFELNADSRCNYPAVANAKNCCHAANELM
jgi:hypothetical protein